jgi:hypothetical protein
VDCARFILGGWRSARVVASVQLFNSVRTDFVFLL